MIAAHAQTVTVVSGNGQLVLAANPSKSMTVLVRDATGKPQPSAQVTWKATGTAGSIGNLSQTTTTTDSGGHASNTLFTPIPNAGTPFVQTTVTATLSSSASNAQFTITTVSNPSNIPQVQVSLTSPTLSQLPVSGPAGQQGTTQVTVLVKAISGSGQGVPNVAVSVGPDIPSNPATIGCASGTVLTNSSGVANCNLVYGGKIGTGSFTVTVGNYVFFPGLAYKVVAGSAATLTITGGNNQAGSPGQTLPLPLVAQLSDLGGNTLAGVTLVFEPVVAGTASFTNLRTTTDDNGKVSAQVILGNVAGVVQVRVRTTDGKVSAVFNLSVNIVLTGFNKISGDQQTALAGAQFTDPLIVQAIANGTGVQGAPVTFTVTSGSAVVGTPNTVTDANGQASATVTAGATAGPIVITASTTSSAGTFTQTFNLSSHPPGPACDPAKTFWNGASYAPNFISPGGVALLTCQGLAPGINGSVIPDTFGFGPLPIQVANVTVQFNGVYAPIYHVSNINGQEMVAVQVPFETPPGDSVPVVVTVNGVQNFTPLTATVLPGAPGIFSYVPQGQTTAIAVMVRPDGSFVSPTNPAVKGETIRAFVTGLIPPDGTLLTNMYAPPPPAPDIAITTPVIVGIDHHGTHAKPSVIYAPNLIGVWEVEFIVNSDAPSGANVAFDLAIPVNGSNVFAVGSHMPIQ
ncbi:MAG TPA: hypothetical protein VFO27_13470 [Bryobacteraceae bacterium]|nr:hypothetical protein [Bryobacteraceae bacterium]